MAAVGSFLFVVGVMVGLVLGLILRWCIDVLVDAWWP